MTMDSDFVLPMFKDKYVRGYSTGLIRSGENPISEGGVWHNNSGGTWTAVRTLNGVAFGTQDGSGGFDDSYAILSGFGPNQSATGTIALSGGITSTFQEVEIHLRRLDSSGIATGYECNLAHDGAYTDIVRWNGALGAFTILSHVTGVTAPSNGDTLTAQVIGNVITVFHNGTQINTFTDSTWATGQPGMSFFLQGSTANLPLYGFSSYSAKTLP